ncbi:nucleoside-diphosphate-sugar epimerase [Sporothrix schenckii 1099-18]|uniref:NAD(P)-binding domain-containing protein n=2 Tax=Sporothrix schenckii TaxID=29908 RepID=U7Q4P0_SPOS1|nr:nucleoside-diphosphate-sugar epimerase [Sporothrix schenckii 1099-18]ERT01965.1 hypothetical protein HMPREF1624_00260 [Sporothrix schenckii ATCC 58251]KJR80866.1 nucleoside-diphosphate-sugar epimerase [Sporothrix schenckii 1099-18]
MAPKIFITGATGYIAGDAFHVLQKTHPEYDYTLLVRSQTKVDAVNKAYPDAKNIHYVIGDNASADAISAAAAAADVVLHTGNSADDIPSAKAIIAGLVKGHTASKPAAYIHISGTGILTWYDQDNKRYGQPPLPEQTYNDYDGVETLVTGLPDTAMHRDVDLVVQAAAREHSDVLRVAIVAPPTIYGAGRGPDNWRSIQVPSLAEYVLKEGYAPYAEGSGETVWDNVHVHDLSNLLVSLVEAGLDPTKYGSAAAGNDKAPGGLFGVYAYYFARAATHKLADVARWVAAAAADQKLVPNATAKPTPVPVFTSKDAPGIPAINLTWALNSHGEAERAHKLLGWTPTSRSLQDDVPQQVADEAKRLGISPK